MMRKLVLGLDHLCMSLVYLLYASSLWMILIYHHCKDNTSSGEQLVAENTSGCSTTGKEDSRLPAALNPQKSFWYLLDFKRATGRTARKSSMPGNIRVHDDAGRPITLKRYERTRPT
jgi:hypothetical protein